MNMNAGLGPPYGVEGGIGRWAPNITAVVRAKAGEPLTYSVVEDGNPEGSKYDLFITVERLE